MSTLGTTSLRDIAKLRSFKRKRVSSYDPTGGNMDNIQIKPGEKRIIFEVDGPGCINHIWSTQACQGAKSWLRHLLIRIWWDNEETPSVECPLGDFFGLGHAERVNYVSEPMQMSPQKGKGFNSWWPMPFRNHAKIEIENDNPTSYVLKKSNPGLMFYYYVEYEAYDAWPEAEEPIGYFHCQFRRRDYRKDMKKDPDTGKRMNALEWQMLGGHNTRENGGYDRNHVILEAKGKGQYAGCHLNIDNRWRWNFNWPGEGDDMIFIDDDVGGEPTLYGTGTEDYVNTAYCPQEKYSAPYHGVIMPGSFNWVGKITYYRYHIQDPISFEKEIKVTIEHGHDNHRGDDWSSTAYWYQLEPHEPFPVLPDHKGREPRRNPKGYIFFGKFLKLVLKLVGAGTVIWGFMWIFNALGI